MAEIYIQLTLILDFWEGLQDQETRELTKNSGSVSLTLPFVWQQCSWPYKVFLPVYSVWCGVYEEPTVHLQIRKERIRGCVILLPQRCLFPQ